VHECFAANYLRVSHRGIAQRLDHWHQKFFSYRVLFEIRVVKRRKIEILEHFFQSYPPNRRTRNSGYATYPQSTVWRAFPLTLPDLKIAGSGYQASV